MSITKDEIRSIFKLLEIGDVDGFFAHVSPNVDWTVMGTHPLAGHYTNSEEFRQKTLKRLAPCLATPLQLTLKTIFVEEETAIIELEANSEALQGWIFDNKYCWIIEFKDKIIVKVRAYLDSSMVERLIAEGEVAVYYRG